MLVKKSMSASIRRAVRSRELLAAGGLSLSLGLMAGLATAHAGSDDAIFTNGSGDELYGTAANWDIGVVPTNNGVTYHVELPKGSTCTLNLTVTIDSLELLANAIFNMNNNTNITIMGDLGGGGSLLNAGTINMNSVGNATRVRVRDGVLEVGDGVTFGEIVLNSNPQNLITGWNGDETLWLRENQVIRGSGQLGTNTLAFINDGAIWSEHPGANMQIDQRTGLEFVTTGTLGARSGGILKLTNDMFHITPDGLFIAENASRIDMSSTTIRESRLDASGSGSYRVDSGTVTLDNCTIDATLTIPNNTNIRLQDETTLLGTINTESVGNATRIYVDNADTTGVMLNGGGTINFSNDTSNLILAWDGGELFHNVNVLIRGGGQIGTNSIGIINDSTIQADVSSELAIDPDNSGMINNGTMRAIGVGSMRLHPATYDNSAGIIEAVGGGTINLNAPTIIGGRVSGDGNFQVVGSTPTFRDIAFSSTLTSPNNNNFRGIDSFVNTGVINIESAGNATRFYVDNAKSDGVQLSGGGTINMSNNASNFITAWDGDEVFNNVDNLIRGAGNIGGNSLGIVNGGDIIADQPAILTIDPSNLGITNTGSMRATGGGTLRTFGDGNFDNTLGIVEADAGSTLEFYSGTHCLNWGNTISLFDDAVMNFSSATIRGGAIDCDPAATSFNVGGTSTWEDLAFNGHMTVQNNTNVRLQDGINNEGTIMLNSLGNASRLYIDNVDSSGVTLTGGGDIILGENPANIITAWDGGEVLHNVNNTIRGGGQVGSNTISINNGGEIRSDANSQMTLDPDGNGMVNSGIVRAADTSTFIVQPAMYENDGGMFEAANNAEMRFQGPHIRDGLVRSTGSGSAGTTAGTTTFEDLSIAGQFTVRNNTNLRLIDNISNSGAITVDTFGNATRLYIDNVNEAGVLLSGGGTILLVSDVSSRIEGWNGDEVLFNLNQTIRGRGSIGNNSLAIRNIGGSIISDAGGDLNIDVNSGGFANRGFVEVQPGSRIEMFDTYLQDTNNALTNLLDELRMAVGDVNIQAGVLRGTGPVTNGDTNNAGVVSPGDGIGTLVLGGSYSQEADGILEIQIAGPTPGTQHDVLDVDDSVLCDGTLRIRFFDGFEPTIGSEYTIITGSNVSGTFDDVYGDGTFTVIYNPTDVRIVVDSFVQTCPGDINLDGLVNVDDLLTLLAGWGGSGQGSDIAEPIGVIDVNDLLTLLAAWGPCL